jgi:signal transduction histidine kinase
VPFTIAVKNEAAVLGIAFDITENKKTEAERMKMIADIVQRNKDLEQFSYIISHNLRAPVATIIGLSELMQDAGHNKDEESYIKDGLYTSVKKLDNVIKDLNHILQIKNITNEKKEIVVFSELLFDIKLSIATLLKNENVIIKSGFYCY